MRKRTQRILVGASVLIALAALATVWQMTSGGPRLYQGKTALEWAERLSLPAPSDKAEALEALRAGGDRALAELNIAIERREPFFNPPLRWLAGRTPPRTSSYLWRRFQLQESRLRRVAAANAAAALRPSDAETIRSLMAALADSDPPVHHAASQALSTIGAPAIPALTNLLSGKSGPLKKRVVYTLGRMRHEGTPAVPHLVAQLRGADPELIEPLERALAAMGPASVPHLVPLLKDPDPALQRAAIRTLTFAGPAAWSAADALAERFETGPDENRQEILMALEAVGPRSPKAQAAWRAGFKDDSAGVRLAAVRLGMRRPHYAAAYERELRDALKDDDAAVRAAAAAVLEQIEAYRRQKAQ